jgi:predicted metalloprotease with PDZ domain
VARVPEFSFGEARVSGVVARLALQKTGVFADPAVAGSIGTGVLRRFRMIVDYAHKRLVLVPNPATNTADLYDRAGIRIGRHGAQFAIFDVVARGPGDRAGLRIGDIVTAINGVKVEQLDLFALRQQLRDPSANTPMDFDFVRAGRKGRARVLRASVLPQ